MLGRNIRLRAKVRAVVSRSFCPFSRNKCETSGHYPIWRLPSHRNAHSTSLAYSLSVLLFDCRHLCVWKIAALEQIHRFIQFSSLWERIQWHTWLQSAPSAASGNASSIFLFAAIYRSAEHEILMHTLFFHLNKNKLWLSFDISGLYVCVWMVFWQSFAKWVHSIRPMNSIQVLRNCFYSK